jgi:hypothetical protein
MQQHKKPRGRGGFTGFLRKLFPNRTGALGPAGSAAEPLPAEPGPAKPKRKGPAHK